MALRCCAAHGEAAMAKLKIILPLLALLLLAVAGMLVREAGRDGADGAAEPVAVACGNLLQGCRAPFRGKTLEVGFSSAPSPLAPFELRVAAPSARKVYAELAMVGMEMDANRYKLVKGDDGLWRGKVILPVCASGRRDWMLTLEVDDGRIQIPFATEK
jgi:hypothetical protein